MIKKIKVSQYIQWGILFSVGLAIISILWIDFGLYNFINARFKVDLVNQDFKNMHSSWDFLTSEIFLALFGGIFVVVGIYRLKNSKFISKLFLDIYLIICLFFLMKVKGVLKYIFGRCVPSVCDKNNGMVHMDRFGFAWFSTADGFISFPSGHCMLASFCLMWVVILYPNFFYAAVGILSLLVIVMVAFNFHFLSDCFAGIAIGLSFGLISFYVWLYIWQRFFNKKIA